MMRGMVESERYTGDERYERYLGQIPPIEFREDCGGRPPVLIIAEACFEKPEDFLDFRELSFEEVEKLRGIESKEGSLMHPITYLNLEATLMRMGILQGDDVFDVNVSVYGENKFGLLIEPVDIEKCCSHWLLEVSGQYELNNGPKLWDALEKDARERFDIGFLIDHPTPRAQVKEPVVKRFLSRFIQRRKAVG